MTIGFFLGVQVYPQYVRPSDLTLPPFMILDISQETRFERPGGPSYEVTTLALRIPGLPEEQRILTQADFTQCFLPLGSTILDWATDVRPDGVYVLVTYTEKGAELPAGAWKEGQPLRGWRVFILRTGTVVTPRGRREEHLLQGQFGHDWNGRYQTAECRPYGWCDEHTSKDVRKARRAAAREHLKTNDCMCGLYAHWDWKATTWADLHMHGPLVLAAVVGWGHTVLAEDGFRCQHMEIEHLFCSFPYHLKEEGDGLADWLQRKFKVPVTHGSPDGTTAPAEPEVLVCPNCGSTAISAQPSTTSPTFHLHCEDCGYDHWQGATPVMTRTPWFQMARLFFGAAPAPGPTVTFVVGLPDDDDDEDEQAPEVP